MTPYWIMLTIPILFLFAYNNSHPPLFWWLITGLLFALFIGYRHEIGCDWDTYVTVYETIRNHGFEFVNTEIGYNFLNLLAAKLDGGVYLVNFFCAVVFMTGAIIFCRSLPSPLLSFIIMIPYIIFVIVMGYTRQGIALGFMFWALAEFIKGKGLVKILSLIMLGVLFHKSAVIITPAILLAKNIRGGILSKILIGSISLPLIYYSIGGSEYFSAKWEFYIETKRESEGALIRVMMNLIPVVILFIYRDKFYKLWPKDYALWVVMAWVTVGFLFFLTVEFASTAVDRAVIYYYPLQIVVLSRLFFIFDKSFDRAFTAFFIVAYYIAVWSVWSGFGSHNECWNPYQNHLLMPDANSVNIQY